MFTSPFVALKIIKYFSDTCWILYCQILNICSNFDIKSSKLLKMLSRGNIRSYTSYNISSIKSLKALNVTFVSNFKRFRGKIYFFLKSPSNIAVSHKLCLWISNFFEFLNFYFFQIRNLIWIPIKTNFHLSNQISWRRLKPFCDIYT